MTHTPSIQPTPGGNSKPNEARATTATEASSLWSLGDDNAISSLEQDAFGRAAFARHLAEVIDSAPRESSFRIGLFGEWGEGKTSVMGMMRDVLVGMGHVCVRISTWATEEPADLLRQIAQGLAKEVDVDAGSQVVHSAASRAGNLKELRKMATEGPWWLQGADLLFGRAAGRVLDEKAEQATSDLLKKALDGLDQRRVIIMVDDLDRTKPEALPQILMALRETVNVPGLFYVLGLSSTAVADGLQKSGYGLEDADRFLEKIIEYPAYLPAISRESLEHYARIRIGQIEGLRRADVLKDLAPLLPQNPRRLKLFLRSVVAMRRTLERFDDEEVNWTELYLALLLLVEFPLEARRLRADSETTSAIDMAWVNRVVNGKQASQAESNVLPEERYAPVDDAERKERFLSLCSRLRDQQRVTSSYRLTDMLHLESAPPLMTRREARLTLQQLEEADVVDQRMLIGQLLHRSGGDAPNVAYILWSFIVKQRTERRHRALLSVHWDERVAENEAIARLRKILACFVRDVGAFRSGQLSGDAWIEWLQSVSMWMVPDGDRDMAAECEAELDALERALEGAPLATVEAIHQALTQKRFLGHIGDQTPTFLEWCRKSECHLSALIADDVFLRFSRPNGLGVYFYCDWYQHGKLLLFSPDSPMYDEAGLKRFEGIADLAVAGDRVVTENLLDFLRLLRAGVEGRISSVSHGTMPAVLGTPGFMRAVWRGATATPLTDTAARLLRDFRVRALKLARVPVEDMPVPAWWSATLKASATADEAVPSESVEHVVAEVEGVEAVTPPIDVPSADAFASGDVESSPQTP